MLPKSAETVNKRELNKKDLVPFLNDLVPFLLSHEGIEYILTERFNQDSLEGFFGQQDAVIITLL